jgi:hypothetical protein
VQNENIGPIGRQFQDDHNGRLSLLNRARLCASLCDPAILPPENQTADLKLPENYQSVGSQGMLNMEGKMLSALFPPGQPWFHLTLSPEYRYDESIPAEMKQVIEQQLFLRELAMQAVLESANLSSGTYDRGGKIGFRTAKRMALAQILVTGDALEQLTDDYRMKVFRRDAYVTRRDPCGDVLYHIIKESIDPLSLAPKVFAKTGLDKDALLKKQHKERCAALYTQVEWMPTPTNTDPDKGYWRIRQEINGNQVTEAREQISPFFCTPFRLAPGEHYGRGFIELNLGDLRTLNEAEKRLLELMNIMSLGIIALDYSSEVRDEDVKDGAERSGKVIRCQVKGGAVNDVALLKFDGVAEASAMMTGIAAKTQRLGRAMLMESESQPEGERVTAYQVDRIAREIDGITGGAYTPIADLQQQPLVRRLVHQMERDKLLHPMANKKAVKVDTLTGAAAIVRASKRGGVMNLVNAAVALGERTIARVNEKVLLDVLARYEGVDEPGLLKDDAQMARETQAAIGQQAALAAAEKAVEVAGDTAYDQMSANNPQR